VWYEISQIFLKFWNFSKFWNVMIFYEIFEICFEILGNLLKFWKTH
jgi:hypothetical protein